MIAFADAEKSGQVQGQYGIDCSAKDSQDVMFVGVTNKLLFADHHPCGAATHVQWLDFFQPCDCEHIVRDKRTMSSLMGKLFGGGAAARPKPAQNGTAATIQQLQVCLDMAQLPAQGRSMRSLLSHIASHMQETIEMLDKKSKHLDQKILNEQREAKKLGMKNKKEAMRHLVRKSRYVKQQGLVDGQRDTLEAQVRMKHVMPWRCYLEVVGGAACSVGWVRCIEFSTRTNGPTAARKPVSASGSDCREKKEKNERREGEGVRKGRERCQTFYVLMTGCLYKLLIHLRSPLPSLCLPFVLLLLLRL